MRHKGLLTASILLLLLGCCGLAALGLLGTGVPGTGTDLSPYSSEGERIYYTGLNARGLPIPRSMPRGGRRGYGMMNVMGCVSCHGEDGRGGVVDMMMWEFEAPDIRYSTLTEDRSEDGTTTPGWSAADIARAIREGVEPDGSRLRSPMQRWQMTDEEVGDVIAYLKELR